MSEKSKEMRDFVDVVSKSLFGRSKSDAIIEKCCVTCGTKMLSFRDELSVREYEISGMCQECQDETFGPEG